MVKAEIPGNPLAQENLHVRGGTYSWLQEPYRIAAPGAVCRRSFAQYAWIDGVLAEAKISTSMDKPSYHENRSQNEWPDGRLPRDFFSVRCFARRPAASLDCQEMGATTKKAKARSPQSNKTDSPEFARYAHTVPPERIYATVLEKFREKD